MTGTASAGLLSGPGPSASGPRHHPVYVRHALAHLDLRWRRTEISTTGYRLRRPHKETRRLLCCGVESAGNGTRARGGGGRVGGRPLAGGCREDGQDVLSSIVGLLH